MRLESWARYVAIPLLLARATRSLRCRRVRVGLHAVRLEHLAPTWLRTNIKNQTTAPSSRRSRTGAATGVGQPLENDMGACHPVAQAGRHPRQLVPLFVEQGEIETYPHAC